MQKQQIQAIKKIFSVASEQKVPLWLDGGWAIDALIGTITRDHSDIDITFASDKKDNFLSILEQLGYILDEETDYGFIAKHGDVVIDAEFAHKVGNHYEIPSQPADACTLENVGMIDDQKIPCVSWAKMYNEFLYLEKEVEKGNWEQKHHDSLKIIESHLPANEQKKLRATFNAHEI